MLSKCRRVHSRIQSTLWNHSRYRSSNNNQSIYVFGTFDTKGEEIEYLYKSISNKLCKWSEPCISSNTDVKIVDISTSKCVTYSDSNNTNGKYKVDFTCRDIIPDFDKIAKLDRGESNAKITDKLHEFIASEYKQNKINGVISLGGSCATAMASSIFTKNLPLGLPKIIISTVASSAMSEQYVGATDLMLLPSIVDISGINEIYKIIAQNASASIVAMAQNYKMNQIEKQYCNDNGNNDGFTIGITMFGITTQCVEYVKSKLNDKYGEDNINILIFHATGTGGKCMEYLTENGFINGVIDITTTEVADYIVGGVLPCDEHRFDSAKKQNIPTIVSLGACNVVNYGQKAAISHDIRDDKQRVFHVHNEQVTLMKANDDELKGISKFISSKINEYNDNHVALMIPKKGVSALDSNGSQSEFCKHGLNDLKILTDNLEKEIANKGVMKYVDAHVNDEMFAESVVNEFDNILNRMNIEIGSGNDGKAVPKRKKKMVDNAFKLEGRRKAIMSSFYEKINNDEPIVGAGAGTGISAKCEVMGGADLVIIYNSGKYRMAGRGSLAGVLAFGDANQIVKDMANEVIPIVSQQMNGKVPVIAGVNGTDPFRDIDRFLGEIKNLGFDGVQNFPTVGLIDGKFRTNLEETGFGYNKEIEFMKIAKEKYDLITTPYVFDVDESIKMAQIGVDIIVIHLGLTVGGNIGAKTLGMTLDDCVEKIVTMANAAYSVNKDQIILVHGGPVANPSDVEYLFNRLPPGTIDGFYGASSMERLPVEISITDQVRQFKNLKLPNTEKPWKKL